MLYLGRNFVLAAVDVADHPLIGIDNVVTVSNIAADSEATGSPATNLANPATHLKWVSGSTSDQSITLTLDGLTEVGFVGIAGHNFGTIGATVQIDADIAAVATDLTDDMIPGDDSPLMFWIRPNVQPTELRINLSTLGDEPFAAVVYVGVPLSMERRIYSDHTPINQAREIDVSNGRSESGEFLGRVILGEGRKTTAPFKLFTPAWVRENLLGFIDDAKSLPFFFAWRPSTYPEEVGYVWLSNDPKPKPVLGDGQLLAFDLDLEGIA